MFSCKKCKYETDDKSDYIDHCQSVEHLLPQPKYKCMDCHFITHQKGHYNRHLKSKRHLNTSNEYICDICDMKLINIASLKAHKELHKRVRKIELLYNAGSVNKIDLYVEVDDDIKPDEEPEKKKKIKRTKNKILDNIN